MRRIVLAVSCAVVLFAASAWTAAQQPTTGQSPNTPRFTGTSISLDGKDLSAARRRFEPGARTYWHSHDNGQLLMVEQGRMRVQRRGEAMKELGVGGSDYTGPNVVHWHGATPDGPLVQINVGFGGESKWFDAVTDAQYSGR
jgi:quercetin dioxygenase-like cupin family protein